MAKASSLAENLVKELECAVCLEQYKEPKVLPCLHSFCKTCLEGLLAKQGLAWKINCPSCRISVEIPKGEVDSLPVNFFLNNLLSMVSLHEDSGSSNLECDNCESGDPPVNRCTTCCHFLCEFCTQGHRRGRGTSSHHILSLEDAKKMGSVAVRKPNFCKEHEGELLKIFCETCDEAICRDCAIVKHREHKYTFVKDAFPKGRESVLKILSETKTKASVLKKGLNGVSEMKTSVQSQAEQTMQEVFNCFQELTACLNTRCEDLLLDIEELKKAKLKSLEIQQGELETALGSVESSIEFTERALENGSEVEVLNMRKQMSCRLQELNSAGWQLEPSTHDVFKFHADYELKQTLQNFGEINDVLTHAGTSTVTMGHGTEGVMYNTLNGQCIEFLITAKECNGRKRKEGGDVFEVEIWTQEGEMVFDDSIKDCGNGAYSFCFTPSHGQMEYQLSVQLNGFHVRGSPFAWFNEVWYLCSEVRAKGGGNFGYIQMAAASMTATYCQTSYEYTRKAKPRRRHRHDDDDDDDDDAYYQQPSGGKVTAFGSSSFGFGKHSWKVSISGNVSEEFAFGVGVSPDTQCPCEFQWTWSSGNKYQPSSQPQRSTITNCMDSDVIELYLDCGNKTLMMYNQRTKEIDTWKKLQGEVRPMFEMHHVGDVVSLPYQLVQKVEVEEEPYLLQDKIDDIRENRRAENMWYRKILY